MKLYLWREVLSDYTDGVAFALASSLEEAKELVRNSLEWASDSIDSWNEPEVIDTPFGFILWGGG